MKYKRKTIDVWRLFHELTELTRKDGRRRLKEYRENCPQYPAELRKGRERVDNYSKEQLAEILEEQGYEV